MTDCRTGRTHDPQPEHGSVYRYTCCKCRCDRCKAGWADWMKRYYRGEVGQREPKGCTEDYLSYGRGCRCGPCTMAAGDYLRAWRARKKEGLGVAS